MAILMCYLQNMGLLCDELEAENFSPSRTLTLSHKHRNRDRQRETLEIMHIGC